MNFAKSSALLTMFTLTAWAEPPQPTSDEVKHVATYLMNGKGKGPILTELKACLTVDTKKGPTQWDCTEVVSGPVKKGATVHAWTSWLVPNEDKYEDVVIQYLLDGQVRSTSDMTLTSGGMRFRSYKSATLSKPGKWEIKVMRGDKELAKATVQVAG